MVSNSSEQHLASCLTIENAIDVLASLENTDAEGFIKWKAYKHQVLFEGDDHFYKIYEESATGAGPFYSLLRKTLADVYSELGIEWNVISFERDGKIYDVEQRQKLKVATTDDGSFSDVFLSFSGILDEVEKRLEFDVILEQLKEKQEFRHLTAIKLLRECVNKFEDYAILEGQAILLDDAEFFIALATDGEEGVSFNKQFATEISVSYGNFLFSNTMQLGEKISRGWHLITQEDARCDNKLAYANNKLMTPNEKSFKHNVEAVPVFEEQSRCDEPMNLIYASLLDENQTDLYATLNEIDENVCVVTSWHPCLGEVWTNNVKVLAAYYPNVQIETEIALTPEFCELCLKGNFDEEDFSGRNKTQIVYVLPNFNCPKRKTFREFLLNLARTNEKSFQEKIVNGVLLRGEDGAYSDSTASMLEDVKQIVESV